MFCAHKIELNTPPDAQPTPLIPREMLAEYTQTRQMLEKAETQAQALIRKTEAQCEEVLKSARDEFWQQANTQLHRWESERQAMFDNLEHTATPGQNQVTTF
ncbi:HrpE/YscL family type III secretion apparatus protein [Pseudomonas costantinii]|uniref:HrpE/YscL family type III secretion apparatus protein n=1 Tax=Pseudomonas costantinii TaxID=168469 RepID=UPI0015A1E423|nr:HrpE/YscL family type III secretion apparatus protein [Pseudomonas costantinii]NVZ73142.1 hypothetical protein [Pseudomonas costantinii]